MAHKDETPSVAPHRGLPVPAPDSPDLHLALAWSLRSQQRFRDAAESFRRVIDLQPLNLQAHIGRGATLHEAGELAAASAAYVQIVQLKPDCAEAWTNLGLVCQDLGDLALAVDMQRQAIALAPEMAEAHNNLGSVFSKLGNTEGALTCFQSALRLEPDHAGAHYNIGHIYQKLGDVAAAETCYRRALAFNPQSETLRYYLGILHLLQGKFSPGWAEYESRWGSGQLREGKRHFSQPQWHGESLHNESILLYGEQGLGDTMQFVRYAPLVAARGGRVILEVQPELRRLIGGMEGVAQVLSPGEPLPKFSWQCPLMSLPLAFTTELGSIPSPGPYLRAGEAEKAAWSDRLSGSGFRIGLVWGGSPQHLRDGMRSIPLAELAPLTAIPGTHFYSLQKGPAAGQLQTAPTGMTISDLEAELRDFTDTAAVVANLDLIICCDTSVAHLAGALGKPVWILLHHMCDWRWLLDREDSPWYPSARLFRKSPAEDWPAVVDRLREEIEKLAPTENLDQRPTQ